jgi:hypothetical protein
MRKAFNKPVVPLPFINIPTATYCVGMRPGMLRQVPLLPWDRKASPPIGLLTNSQSATSGWGAKSQPTPR